MIPVIIESPYAGEVERNLIYARRALRHALSLGEAPLASHLLYPQVLDDLKPDERGWGLEAGLVWLSYAKKHIFYIDYGWSHGMYQARNKSDALGIEQEVRTIGENRGPK